MNAALNARIPHYRWPLTAIAAIGTGLCLWGLFGARQQEAFFRGYLIAWLFYLGLALGGMALVMVHNLTGGPWCRRARPIARAASLTLPLLAIGFFPLLAGLGHLYPWARPAEVAASDALRHRAGYLSVPFFAARSIFYLALWSALALLLTRWQRHWHRAPSAAAAWRIRALSAAGLILYVMAVTHAGVDWILSREVEFYSTAFGLVLAIGQTLSAFAFAIVLMHLPPVRRAMFADDPPGNEMIDIGNILMVLVILWAYVSFMQFLVVWMGNSGEDISWYTRRGMSEGAPGLWGGLALILLQFFIPFYVLLFRAAKRNTMVLAGTAGMVLAAHVLEVFWLAAPGQQGPAFAVTWLDIAAFVAIGGWWLVCFLWLLDRRLGVDEVPDDLAIEARGTAR